GLDVLHLLVAGAPEPIAPFSHATMAGAFVFVTGQMPIVPDTGAYVRGSFAEQTDAVMKNLGTVLAAAGSDWDHVLHCRIYLTDFSRYAEVNDAYRRWFPSGKLPARTCIGVTALAGGAGVEIDLLAVKR
ncbi:MAG TPA: RidA family protein, partial [Polyangiaceae bacterium]|nr:RidA family protein [Polyangiaceae bacterium]